MTTSRKLDATPRASATLPLALPRQDPTAAEATAGTHNRVASENLEGRRRRGSAKYKRVCSGEKDRAAYRSAAAHAYTGAAQAATLLCRRTPRSPVLASSRSLPPVAACSTPRKETPAGRFLSREEKRYKGATKAQAHPNTSFLGLGSDANVSTRGTMR